MDNLFYSNKNGSADLFLEDDCNNASEEDESTLPHETEQTSKKRKFESKGKKAKKVKKEMKVAPPTSEEMIHLRETENLFKSNLFRLEIEEMLKEIKPFKIFRKATKSWIRDLKQFLCNLNGVHQEESLNDLSWLQDVGICLPLPKTERLYKGTFKFAPPVDVKPVGSFNAGCLMGPKFSADVAIVIPRYFFLHRDCINHTYHIKRALYLCTVALKLKESELLGEGSELEFWTPSGDPLKPVLVVNPKGKAENHIRIILHIVPEGEVFKISKMAPQQSNIRNDWWGFTSSLLGPKSTPLYNNSIVEDVIMLPNESVRSEAFEGNDNMKDAVSLLRIWLKQRELDEGYGSFSTYIMSMLLIYLKEKQKINKFMSSYQILRNTWLYLSQANWCTDGITMSKADLATIPAISVFHGYFEVVFIDPSGFCNLTARMSRLTFLKVKAEAALAIQHLDNKSINGFQALFMVKMPFLRQYDHIICFKDEDVLTRVIENEAVTGSQIDFGGFSLPQFIKLTTDVLMPGLRCRAKSMCIQLYRTPHWKISEKCNSNHLMDVLLFGIQLDPQNSLSVIEKGPQANLPEATGFREFWCEKSELRRFRDGTVCESMVWASAEASLPERMLITKKIINFLLDKKLNVAKEKYIYIADQLDDMIALKVQEKISTEEASLKVHKALEDLTQKLTGLEDLPLSITAVHCISSVYRYTEIFPPTKDEVMYQYGNKKFFHQKNKNFINTSINNLPTSITDVRKLPHYIPTVDLVARMELSGKWPDDLAACKRLTAAFFIAIGRKLDFSYALKCMYKSDCLVIQKDGIMFRLFLGNSKEISLLKLNITEKGEKQYRDTPESIHLEKNFINLPKLTGALQGLSLSWPGFGATARLAKRWLSAQLIDSSHIPYIVVELLVASLFLKPEPFQPMVQPLTMFLRFLSALATTNWHSEPLIVNFNNLLSVEEVRRIEEKFRKERATLPAMFVATPYDHSGTLWTKRTPALPTLVRLASLASKTLQILELHLVTVNSLDIIFPAFRPSMKMYDAILKLNPTMITRFKESIHWTQERNTSKGLLNPGNPIIDFDPPMLLLKELRDHYSEFALFFYDKHGGLDIGVLFKPKIFEHCEFKVASLNGRKPTECDSDKPLKTDVSSLLSDFQELGSGLVLRIITSEKIKSILSTNEGICR